jgi:putative DNA primase/helicase
MHHVKTTEASKGKWRGILIELGVPESALKDKHGPCPICEGTDRFRWDNKEGKGTWICSHCGSGDGMELAKQFTGDPFLSVAKRIDELVGNIKPDPHGYQNNEMPEGKIRTMLREVYSMTTPATKGDYTDRYLAGRKLWNATYPKSLRTGRELKDGEGGIRPAMVAIVVDADGNKVTMHRTFLKPDGLGKAEMATPRKLMPGKLPEGSCIRMSDGDVPAHLGIAEGIETAMSASSIFGIPVWAVLNAVMMEKWIAPAGVTEVTVFGDNDENFRGQAAAYTLAHRLAMKGLTTDVCIPRRMGDWNDELTAPLREQA